MVILFTLFSRKDNFNSIQFNSIQFQHGKKASDWKIKKLLSSLHKIFDKSSSRRADYELITDAREFDYPLPFCSHRCVEDERVVKKARSLWDKIPVIVDYRKGLPRSKQPGQGKVGANTSYDHLCVAYKDPLVLRRSSKIHKCLLIVFQTDQPMVPFLAETLDELIQSLFSKFIPQEVLDSRPTSSALLKIDLNVVNIRKNVNDVDLGFAVNYELDLLKKSGKVTNTQIVTFKKCAVQFLVSLEKCPLKSQFTKYMQFLSPSFLAESPEAARIMFEKIVRKLVEYHTINAGDADASKQQYNKFFVIVKNNREESLNFDKVNQRLDEFYWMLIN